MILVLLGNKETITILRRIKLPRPVITYLLQLEIQTTAICLPKIEPITFIEETNIKSMPPISTQGASKFRVAVVMSNPIKAARQRNIIFSLIFISGNYLDRVTDMCTQYVCSVSST